VILPFQKIFDVQRLKGGNPTGGLHSGRLVTRPRECKENRTADLTKYCGEKGVKRKCKKQKYNQFIFLQKKKKLNLLEHIDACIE